MACDPATAAEVLRGIDSWFAADPQSNNWWYNQLGVPIALGDILLLMDEFLSDEQRRTGCDRLARSVWTDMAAQNLVWAAEGTIRRGLLQRDPAIVGDAISRIASTLIITNGEGVQPDRSFHEHGPLLYFMGYGHDFAVDSARTAYLAADTSFAFSEARVAVIVDYLLDGSRWVIHRSTYDFTAMGRVLARPDAQDAWQELIPALQHVLAVSTDRREELQELLDQLTDQARASGHRHFWRSDFTAHHRPTWSTSIKMCSTRTAPTETGNGEGLLSWYLGEGINPVFITGEEYRDIYPVWNWRRLPGLTAEQSSAPLPELNWHKAPDGSVIRGSRAEVGGLAEGGSGLATMRLAKDNIVDGVKSWFCFDTEIVALGAGISAPDAEFPVWTTINQCLNEGEVGQGDDWAHHGRIAYVVQDGGDLVVQTETQTGSWSRIGVAQSAEPMHRDVTTIAINHGPRPQDAHYAYIVVPDVPDRPEPATTILRNDAAVQAVRNERMGITQVAFHQAGEIAGIAVDGPVLVQLRDGVLSVADHTRRGGSVTVTLAGGPVTVAFPAGEQSGATVTVPG